MKLNLRHIVDEVRRSYERARNDPGASKSSTRSWPHQTARKFFTDIDDYDSYDIGRGVATLKWNNEARTIEVVNVNGTPREKCPKAQAVMHNLSFDFLAFRSWMDARKNGR